MSREWYDFSDVWTVWPYDPRPDMKVSWVMDRPNFLWTGISKVDLDAMREAILALVPEWTIHFSWFDTLKLPNIRDTMLEDIDAVNQTLIALEKAWKSQVLHHFKNAKLSVHFWKLQLLLIDYWMLWSFDISDADIEFLTFNPELVLILWDLLWEIINEDFRKSWNPEISAKVAARKIRAIELILKFSFKIPAILHSNYRNLLETELRLCA